MFNGGGQTPRPKNKRTEEFNYLFIKNINRRIKTYYILFNDSSLFTFLIILCVKI